MFVKVCYIIPVYNNQAGLNKTINSIRVHDKNIKIYVYDDGSKEPVVFNNDVAVDIIRGHKNKGIGFGMNKLIETAFCGGYDFAALIDAGDLAKPERIGLQLEFMMSNGDVCISGGGMDICSIEGVHLGCYMPPTTPPGLKKAFRRGYPFVHPTAMFRVKDFRKKNLFYMENSDPCVDFDLLYKMHKIYPNSIANIEKVLVNYVREAESIGVKRSALQARSALKIRFINSSISDLDSILGIFDIRLWIRAASPKIFYKISKIYAKI